MPPHARGATALSAKVEIVDAHLSAILQGVSATAHDGGLTFSIFVSGDALAELGASRDTWLEAFAANEQRIAELASIQRRRTKASSVFITSLV